MVSTPYNCRESKEVMFWRRPQTPAEGRRPSALSHFPIRVLPSGITPLAPRASQLLEALQLHPAQPGMRRSWQRRLSRQAQDSDGP